ncbi:hypothetical protein GA0115259_105834 [Streptomyces sp. MnatMP-M17]|nr:hypothetical protein GA0115259_105834 [Streptomyces sp. MnatMP-M17]
MDRQRRGVALTRAWEVHRENDIEHHEAYDQGMRRLSCRACPLAHTDDLRGRYVS